MRKQYVKLICIVIIIIPFLNLRGTIQFLHLVRKRRHVYRESYIPLKRTFWNSNSVQQWGSQHAEAELDSVHLPKMIQELLKYKMITAQYIWKREQKTKVRKTHPQTPPTRNNCDRICENCLSTLRQSHVRNRFRCHKICTHFDQSDIVFPGV